MIARYFVSRCSLDALRAALATHTRVLDATEGCGHVRDDSLIDADHAGLEPVGYAKGPVDVLGEYVCRQAERRVVGEGNRLVLGVEPDDGRDGSEHLLREDPGVGATLSRTAAGKK